MMQKLEDDDRFQQLQEGIERIRRMSQRIAEAHELVTANNNLLRRDSDLVRSGPLQEFRDLRTHASQPGSAERAHAPRRPIATRTRRRG